MSTTKKEWNWHWTILCLVEIYCSNQLVKQLKFSARNSDGNNLVIGDCVSISMCRKWMPEYAVCSTKTLLGIDKYQTNDDGHTQCINQVPALKVCDWTIRYSHISIALRSDRMLFAWNQCMPNSYVPIRNLHLCWSNNNIWAHLTLSLLSPTSRIISSKKKKRSWNFIAAHCCLAMKKLIHKVSIS